ncbi:MAG TPA: M1 family metallopeptidase [Gemmatimonadales bacterium]|nr:M1 family metallopeptidase [Gemmatimonadales bacterium]
MFRTLARSAMFVALTAGGLAAQGWEVSPFRPLALPGPNMYRTGSGRPGPGYWQQRVDYRIDATLDPAANELRGREVINYQNRSPDALPYLWMHLEQNMCAPGSVTSQLDQPPLVFLGSTFDFSCQGFAGGIILDSVLVDGRPLRPVVHGTTMRLDLPAALAAGASAEIVIRWRFKVPPYGGGRMGHDGTLYEFGQWYPRMAVYDDLRGWNHEPYIGAGEFYLEYGRFEVDLTLPAGYLVAATGTLRNPEQVLTAAQRSRLAQAAASTAPVAVITKAEAGQPARTRPTTDGTLTWRFTADSVRDFAFAASPNFQWDASAWEGVMIHTLYRPAATLWAEANKMTNEALAYFSRQWLRYPYPQFTSIEGPIEGMEYPMITFDPTGPTREDVHWVLAHELGHQWVPMVVGSNERLYPWMDEGFNTFIDLANAARYFKGTAYGDSIEVHPLHLYADHAVPGEQPLIARPVEVTDLFWAGYQKPALMMQLLRYEVLGTERFDAAFRQYLNAWAFRHPSPADFFRLMRDASGTDLDWFWREWVMTATRLDQAVDTIASGPQGVTEVRLASLGTMIMPAELRLTFADGTTEVVRLPVEMWNLGPRFTYRVRGKPAVRSAELDPRRALPDVDRANNRYPR